MSDKIIELGAQDMPEPTKQASPLYNTLELVEARLSAIPGQSSIMYYDHERDTIVSICPVPQIATVAAFIDQLAFAVLVFRKAEEFSSDEAALYAERAANCLDFTQLLPAATTEITFNLVMEKTAIAHQGGIGYHASICVPVARDLLDKNLKLAIAMGRAAQVISDSLAVIPAANDKIH